MTADRRESEYRKKKSRTGIVLLSGKKGDSFRVKWRMP
ncbi:hypothetical protein CLOLEP_02757 [[Clostridium] leptum DSM 753]|uniref:Uncharacterized protein n=1 Tax=[Clostridium] leptum DSM 753 TaxID=428125 RepID=A7VVZ3_9FIRM|nr:hypothetical protein CLOLEP_02757 [[Clostridium] leptum DSM 753]